MKRCNPNYNVGLTTDEVLERKKQWLVNYDDQPKTKSIQKIIFDNTFTYFNFINVLLVFFIILAGIINNQLLESLKNSLFIGVVFLNSMISITAEVISKRIIDVLTIYSDTIITVIRDSKEKQIKLDEIVLDDVIKLNSGNQIICDSIVLEGKVEVNESFITGESDTIIKNKGDNLLSGSFVVSGFCYAKVEHIGSDNYVSVISKETKKVEVVKSVIMRSFEKLLKMISIGIIPISLIMFLSQFAFNGNLSEAIYATSASLIGIIPGGLVLLTSSVMATSVIRLYKYKILVQQLYCIESLARVDVICLDKTGTLTEGRMKVVDYISCDDKILDLYNKISLFSKNSNDNNATMNAIKDYFTNKEEKEIKEFISFSSDKKYSALVLDDKCLYIGAPDFLVSDRKIIDKYVDKYIEDYRVLAVGKSKSYDEKLKNIDILGFVIIEDVIRSSAKKTLDYFEKEGVLVKIISGDTVKTVLNIAKKVGIKDLSGINVNNLSDSELEDVVLKHNVFGRVKPRQKKTIVEILQKHGHTVAMTGDGVNDVLALKQSDCSISVASGSDAAKNVSQLVLLDDNFDHLPKVVLEGRRIINNIERSASLLLIKTIYTMLLIVLSIVTLNKFFFLPIQLTLITSFTIGTPSFILALEPNKELVTGNFFLKIIKRSLPVSLTVLFNVISVLIISAIFNYSFDVKNTLIVLLTAMTGFIYLFKVCYPFTLIRGVLFTVMLMGFTIVITKFNNFFNLISLNNNMIIIFLILSIISIIVFEFLKMLINYIFKKYIEKSLVV